MPHIKNCLICSRKKRETLSMKNSTASSAKNTKQSFSFITWKKEQVEKGAILEAPSSKLLTTWYAEQLINGNILASKKNVLDAKRHMKDYIRQGTDDFPWVFVVETGNRPIRFIDLYSIHSIVHYI